MEQTATGSTKLPYYSKLQELLTADRGTRRSDLAETSSAASISGDSLGDDGTNSSSDAMSDKYRNPRKRLLLSSMNASEADESPDDQSDKGKKIMKLKSDASNGCDTGDINQGPASFKVAPIVLKKYYPKAVQSAECEEFLVSLSEDDTQSDGNRGAVLTRGSNSDSEATKPPNVKPKDDYEYMGAQIDKLLNMSSPKNPWKTPRRRKFQCDEANCTKSYSSEDDLKSHKLSHSPGNEIKPFGCDTCSKRFKWAQALKKHRQKCPKTDPTRNSGTEDERESSQEMSMGSPNSSMEESPQKVDDKAKTHETPKTDPGNSLTPAQIALNQSFESVVCQIIRNNKAAVDSNNAPDPVEKPLLTRSQLSAEKKPTSSRRSSRKDPKSSKKAKLEANRAGKKKASSPVAEEETDESASPLTPTTGGRTSLRRNIQRPKWLSDADLVTDYEFPRGTNNLRAGVTSSTGSPATTPTTTTTTTAINGTRRQSRTASTDSTSEPVPVSTPKTASVPTPKSASASTPKSQKTEKGKPCPPSSRDRKRKEENNKNDAKKAEIPKKVRKVRETKNEKKSKIKDKPANKSKNRKADIDETRESPTKHLSTKILTLSLEDVGKEASLGKSLAETNGRKRPGSESPLTSLRTQENRKSKRKRSLDVPDKPQQSNGIDGATNLTLDSSTSSRANDEQNTNVSNIEKKLPDTDVEAVTNSNETMSVVTDEKGSEKVEANLLSNEIIDKKSEVIDDVELASEEVTQRISQHEPVPAETEENVANQSKSDVVEGEVAETLTDLNKCTDLNDPTKDEVPNVGDSSEDLAKETVSSANNCQSGSQEGNTEVLPIAGHFLNCEALSFADIAKGIALMPQTTAPEVENRVAETDESKTDAVGEEHRNSDVVVPIVNNDEEMPILRPETSSSAAGSRSDSFAERMQSIDEDVSSSSNHSVLPQAPVLLKEATGAPSFANGIVQIPQDCKTDSTGSTVPDNQEELPLIDDDEGLNSRLRRDRSDSLSVRSFGSGSQSEKIKALDDTSSKDKRPMTNHDHECLVDSDSNDSLMSEFSELAAQISEKTDGIRFKEECLRFLTTKVSSNSMWAIRKELKRLKKDKNYFKFGKLSPLAAGLMHDIFCQSLE